ncbi:MAG: dihydrolipoyl dehydrogenase [Chthoniobacter sp.]|uniref:dihydrolipoyl dehydrogenase n=1 Tax=Chthoniobacter sp. TaxID=2510640 RepID=UPI0032A5A6AF
MANYDLIVIGAGPAGYVAAIKAAQLGKKVACVDKERTGGTCNNYGCIPTKALLRNAELFHTMKHRATEFGFKIEGLSYDWGAIFKRSRTVSEKGTAGVDFLFKKNKIDSIRGEASMDKAGEVKVKLADGKTETHTAKNVLIATGCVSRPLPGLDFKGNTVIGSKEALALPEQPKSMIIIGAGAIGVEFAYFFNAFGTKVTIVEMLPNILPVEDTEVSQALEKSFVKQGITLLTNHKTTKTEVSDKGVKITVADAKNVEKVLEADAVLVAIGVAPVLPAGSLKFELVKGYLKTDDRYQTTVPGVYAAGDIIGPPWLAHVASYEAVQAVEGMFNPKFKPKKVTTFPGCTYCQPQVASVGLTERAAKEKGLKYKIGKFPYMALGKARAIGEPEGFLKLIVGEPHGEILGAHIIGAEATEVIAELGLAITLEATLDEIEATIHAHPTLGEIVREAAEVALGHAIHI